MNYQDQDRQTAEEARQEWERSQAELVLIDRAREVAVTDTLPAYPADLDEGQTA